MQDNLQETEKRAFRAVVDTGLWDVMIATFVSSLAIAPLLSERMGDFWSSAIFLPIWAIVYVLIRIIKRRVVEPRIGVAYFGPVRKARLGRFGVIMLLVNVIALVVGTITAFQERMTWSPPVFFGMVVLLTFSLAAYFLDIPRYFLYGVLLVVAGAVGELLWHLGLASHHGYPVVFGISAALIAVTGLLRFAKYLPPKVADKPPATFGRNHD